MLATLPVLLLDHDTVYIIIGKTILCQTELDDMAKAVVAFLASFYLLDFDYIKQHELGLLMLQVLVLGDKQIPADIAHHFDMEKQYRKYKSEAK